MSTIFSLELLGVTVSLDVSGPAVSFELAGVAASLELPAVWESEDSGGMTSSGGMSPPRGSSEPGDELSSQAFNVNAAAMPSTAARVLLVAMESGLPPEIFFFSIFIATLL
jgi:hypothetical protein